MPDHSKIELSPATVEDVRPFYATMPSHRLWAWVAKKDGTPIGVGGIYFLDDGTRVGFIELTEEGEKHPRDLVKATRKFLKMLRDEGIPKIIAVPDPGIEAATRFMKHFGFQVVGEFQSHMIYVWTK